LIPGGERGNSVDAEPSTPIITPHIHAGVAELVDAADSKSASGDRVGVRVPPSALNRTDQIQHKDQTMDEQQPQQQQVQLRIDESKMSSTYANTIRTSNTQDELIMDFGMNIPMQAPNQAPVVVFNVGSRVIMNWAGAKRLALSIGSAVRQYEERFGEIDINPGGGQQPPA
jgi:hypothetical protein